MKAPPVRYRFPIRQSSTAPGILLALWIAVAFIANRTAIAQTDSLQTGDTLVVHPALPDKYVLVPMDGRVNTIRNDYAPCIGPDGRMLLFTSHRPFSHGSDTSGQSDLLYSRLDTNGARRPAVVLQGVNTAANDGSAAIAGDGETIVIASDRDGGYGDTDLYIGRIIEGIIAALRNMGPAVNTEYWESQPTLSRDSNTMLFASDRSGGYGGLDIWISHRVDDDLWSEPVNAGPSVNSDANDMAPYLTPDGRWLFFSSDRVGGAGGYDLYVAAMNGGRIGEPEHLEGDINTPYDELFIVAPSDTSTFYLATARPGGPGGVDIWSGRPVVPPPKPVPIVLEKAPPLPDTVESFDLGAYNIPFFVTGYYRPNTPESLDSMITLLTHGLRRATYIERFSPGSARYKQYEAWGHRVEDVFGEVRTAIADRIIPAFASIADSSEHLEITVTGFADPRPFHGLFEEPDPISFFTVNGEQQTIDPGDTIGNPELSGLRAWFAGTLLEKLIEQSDSPDVRALLAANRLRFRQVAGGVDSTSGGLEAQRRITITVERDIDR